MFIGWFKNTVITKCHVILHRPTELSYFCFHWRNISIDLLFSYKAVIENYVTFCLLVYYFKVQDGEVHG